MWPQAYTVKCQKDSGHKPLQVKLIQVVQGENTMFVKTEISTWFELSDMVWSGAKDTLREIEKQGREEEALDILEEIFNPDFWGSTPTDTDINDYIWFDLADHMNLYGEDDEKEDDDDDEE